MSLTNEKKRKIVPSKKPFVEYVVPDFELLDQMNHAREYYRRLEKSVAAIDKHDSVAAQFLTDYDFYDLDITERLFDTSTSLRNLSEYLSPLEELGFGREEGRPGVAFWLILMLIPADDEKNELIHSILEEARKYPDTDESLAKRDKHARALCVLLDKDPTMAKLLKVPYESIE